MTTMKKRKIIVDVRRKNGKGKRNTTCHHDIVEKMSLRDVGGMQSRAVPVVIPHTLFSYK